MTTAKQLLTKARMTKTSWGARIIKAEQSGTMVEGARQAWNWTDCACGKQSALIPRFTHEESRASRSNPPADGWMNPDNSEDTRIAAPEALAPIDNELRSYGMLFPRAIEAENWPHAAELLVRIENRAAVLEQGIIADMERKLATRGLRIVKARKPVVCSV